MRLSIITVVKNDAPGLEKTIRSIIPLFNAQPDLNIEYIVIDGNSADNIKDIIDKYMKYITIFVSEDDGGIYDAMNKGVKASSGDYLYFLNANDTLICPGLIDLCKKEVSNEEKKYTLISGKVNIVDSKHTRLGYTHPLTPPLPTDLVKKNCIAHQGTLIPKDIFLCGYLFRPEYKIMGDYDLWIRLYKTKKYKFIFYDIAIANFVNDGLSSKRESAPRASREQLSILYENNLPIKHAVLNILTTNIVFVIGSILRRITGRGFTELKGFLFHRTKIS